ncbi:jg15369 [Pararge aegeria aegeria]|uniref:Jg15369 protein n=1 Tax=Pararge aegeria aegeria TaxID=348720 RepID=A0A8S4S663_9NEOP|nr:jg15369 [Pararge aegeria aegeria]
MDVGVPRCWNGGPELVSAVMSSVHLVGARPTRWTDDITALTSSGLMTLSASQVAARSNQHRTVEFETPYKRPMSSSGRLSVDMIMLINRKQ